MMSRLFAFGAVLASVFLAIAFVRALPAAAVQERVGRQNEVAAICEMGLKPEKESPVLGPLPAAPKPFTLKDWNQHDISVADTRGRVTLVNFWATWCPTCVVEMPSLEKLAETDKRLSVLAVTVDESWEPVYKFFAGRSTPLTVLLDADKTVPPAYGTEKFPETFILDKEGKVRFYVVSDRNWMSPDIVTCLSALENE